jgi:glutathione S-transferase
MPAAPAFKLVYFDLLAKGLPVAMVAAHSGLPWEGKDRDTFDWKTVKATQAPFGQMPLLFLPDGRVVAQSTAIATVIARLAGPARDYDGAAASDADFATSAMLLAEAEDIYAALQRGQPTKFVPIGEGGKTDATHAELWADDGRSSLPRHLRCLEALVGPSGDAFTASGTTAGEMYLWGMLHQIAILDESTLASTPGVDAFYRRVLDSPATRDVLEGRSPMGEMGAYFVKGTIR